MNCTKLTKNQKQVFDYIVTFIGYKGYPPTTKEIATRMGTKHRNTGLIYIKALRKKGAVRFDEGRPGSLRLVNGYKPTIKGEQK